jgi:hypothetical protein
MAYVDRSRFNQLMDSNGAKELQRRIEQQQHWRQAQAVRDGRQPASDPDAAALTQLADGIRVYQSELVTKLKPGGAALVLETLVKRLVDGWWRSEIVEDDAVLAAAHGTRMSRRRAPYRSSPSAM